MKDWPNKKIVAEIYKELDQDGDDDISPDELSRFLKKMFI